MSLKSKLFEVLKILPTDYVEYGGEIKRWADPAKDYPDCSRGCKYFVPLDGELKYDWGVCGKKGSPRAGLLTWEHQTGVNCFEAKEKTICSQWNEGFIMEEAEKKINRQLYSISMIMTLVGYILIWYSLGFLVTLGFLLIMWSDNLNNCLRLEKLGVKDLWLKI